MAEQATLDSATKPADLRERLIADIRNIELRQKYLATRTAAWAVADLRSARSRLVIARVMRGIVGMAFVGLIGGLIGEMLLPTKADVSGARALPIVVGAGTVLSSCAIFALLGSIGWVVLPEIVGEERASRHGEGSRAILGKFVEAQMEAVCGGVWGAVCGLFMGLLILAVHISVGLPAIGSVDAVLAGAIGGSLLGIVFGLIIVWMDRRHGPSATVRAWSGYGPLPIIAYLFTARLARKFYLGK